MAVKRKEIKIEKPRKTVLTFSLEGTSPLILRGMARSYIREEVFKQGHPKGTKIPHDLDTKINHNLYERLITSIHWKNPIEVFDDYSLYTKEMWEELMEKNQPCILAKAFKDSMKEVFISFGYKESTGRNGTDLDRTIAIMNQLTPITFEKAEANEHIAKTSGVSSSNVLTDCNIFYGWKAELVLSHVNSVFPSETIISIVQNAGEYIGLGSRRKEAFGRYEIKNVSAYEE